MKRQHQPPCPVPCTKTKAAMLPNKRPGLFQSSGRPAVVLICKHIDYEAMIADELAFAALV